jgi:amino acid adenylation domain-containing protein
VALFEASTVQRLSDAFACLFDAALEAPDEDIAALALQPQSLPPGSTTEQAAAPSPVILPELFVEWAQRQPDAVAIVHEDDCLSYADLDARATRLAHRLLAVGSGPGDRVGICLPRSVEWLVAILAIWKAGAAYVPLDPSYPQARLRFMVEDAALTRSVAVGETMHLVAGIVADILNLDRIASGADCDRAAEKLPALPRVDAADLAYIIYTSGSTGQPKGVCIEHGNLSNLAENIAALVARELGTSVVRWAWNASLSFDASLQAISQLGYGAELHLLSDKQRQHPQLLLRMLAEQKVQVVDCTPSQLRIWLDAHAGGSLPMLLIGGEAIGSTLWSDLRARHRQDGQIAYNVYGPTEACVDATACRIDDNSPEESLGQCLDHVQAHVLDARCVPVPTGVVGELYLGGAGVGRGDVGADAQTQPRFVPDSFSAVAGARLYRTGDRVRRCQDGRLTFVGRSDGQCKLNGYRIEISEIEARLATVSGLQQSAAVVVHGAGGSRLLACVVTDEPTADSATVNERVRRALSETLPPYMVPSGCVLLDQLPLTASGKLDRRALQTWAAAGLDSAVYVAPIDALEQQMCALWQRLLEVERVGRSDDFFLLGGHSIAAIRLLSRLRSEFGWELSLRAVFEHPTVAALVALGRSTVDSPSRPTLIARRDAIDSPLSFAQQRIWFLQRLDEADAALNICGALHLSGPIDVNRLARSIDQIIERHALLRSAVIERR